MRLKLTDTRGLTLVEIMLAIVISFILLAAAGRFFRFNLNFYGDISERAGDQSEFRFMLEDIERQVGTATEVALSDSVGSTADKTYLYTEAGSLGNVVKKKLNGSVSHFGGGDGIDGLELEWTIPSDSRRNVVLVSLKAHDNILLSQEIYLQNTDSATGNDGQVYSVIRFVEVEP